MGRSVNYLTNADAVYFHQLEEHEIQDFDFLLEDIREHVMYKYPEFEAIDEWEDRDVNVILQSPLVEIAISEGSVEIDEAATEDDAVEATALETAPNPTSPTTALNPLWPPTMRLLGTALSAQPLAREPLTPCRAPSACRSWRSCICI